MKIATRKLEKIETTGVYKLWLNEKPVVCEKCVKTTDSVTTLYL